jgi:2-polyprenyl-6-methoxyphenol hydroxylase-like FAD-dependent oxidoreductase
MTPLPSPADPLDSLATRQCDVLVIGGGPAGSTLATLLARQGRQVTLIEKAHHPRFHIGESLLPANVSLFDDLGVREQVESIGMPKWGVEFVSPDHAHRSYLEFGDALDKSMPYAWQVRRADLDEILFRNAEKSGATTLEGHRARNVEFDAEGATVDIERDDGTRQTWRCRYVVDATAATRCSRTSSSRSRSIRTTRVRHSTVTSRTPAASTANRKATSRSCGSRMAGSGSSRSPMAPPASAPSAGRTT